ncbi:MAG TPA: histidine kinase dimerization/phospho-acceptor domain-containing protein [Thermoanaerobaculia bacterium]
MNLPPDTAERTRRAFVANLRHELRTPLNAIIGYSEMLLEDVADEGPEELSPDLEKTHAAGAELLALVNVALDPAKVSAVKTGADLESLGVKLRHELRTPLNAIIGYSEMLLEEAEDLGAAGAVPDLQKIHSSAEHFLSLLDDVADFARIEAGEASSHLGATGASAMARAAAMIQESYPKDESVVGENPLLIVDDNEINRDVLARQLGRQGHATAVAENGRRALEMARARKFDLMLLDIMMPEMSGYEVLGHLKADVRLRDIPVIMISALDEVESVVRCIELGAEDYLPKPFDPVLLRARIGACLEKKRLRDQEVEYLRNVDLVTAAAAAVEAGEFNIETIEDVAQRSDELGQLARVFRRMTREVYARERRLKQEVRQLRIEIDESRTARQVAEITETDYFQDLQKKVDKLRFRADDVKP